MDLDFSNLKNPSFLPWNTQILNVTTWIKRGKMFDFHDIGPGHLFYEPYYFQRTNDIFFRQQNYQYFQSWLFSENYQGIGEKVPAP